MGCGTGKTRVSIEAIRAAWMPALIVAPKRVIDHTWPDELLKWWPECEWESLATAPKRRAAILSRPAPQVTLINYELLPTLLDSGQWRWPMVVLDESTRIKSRASVAFKTLRKSRGRISRMVQLTGTPSPNGLTDLWSQLYLLDGGERLGRTLTAYRERYFRQDFMGYRYTPLPGAQQQIEALCADLCLAMRTEDYIAMPPMTEIDVTVDLPAPARAAYRAMQRDLVAEIGSATVTATTAATMLGKLTQITSGAVYDEAGAAHTLHSAKLDALADIVDSGEPALVVYQYRHELAALRQRWPEVVEVRDSADAIARWNAGEISLLAVHPASAGHGLNLQRGGRLIVWLTPTYNLEHYEQTNARLYRNGQTAAVVVYRIAAADTVDQRVLDALRTKGGAQSALIGALRA